MGNRAVITGATDSVERLKKDNSYLDNVGVYLHWNGGRDSVEAFLTYCKMQGFRSPESDNYGIARLAQVIANYFEGGLSVGVDKCRSLDCEGDNGVYFVKHWRIVGRANYDGYTEQAEHDLEEALIEIDKAQPVNIQLGEELIKEQLKLIKAIVPIIEKAEELDAQKGAHV